MPDKLIKELLDHWLQLDLPAAITQFLAPYPQLCSFYGQLFDLMEVMQVEFDCLDAKKKAKMSAKCKAKRMMVMQQPQVTRVVRVVEFQMACQRPLTKGVTQQINQCGLFI